ncbi:MAG TPA: SIS domain-containing protein [bacterium]|nr:SIS domain-containing protein [bacterium]
MTPDVRTAHPFYMHDAMREQPDAFAAVAARTAAVANACAPRLASCDRLYFVGIGTSYHAALTAEYLVRAYGGMPVYAAHAFDFALYGPALGPRDGVITISHRGTKRYSRDALVRSREAGCPTVVVTGNGPEDRAVADVVIQTVPQERSSTHTVSYAGAVAALAVLTAEIGALHGARPTLDATVLRETVPAALREALALEPQIAGRAHDLARGARIWLVGGGPGAVAAIEGALKIKETSYGTAEGMSAEAMLHGPFQSADPGDLFILVAQSGAAQPRVMDVAAAVQEIGAQLIVVDNATAPISSGVARWSVPAVPEPFTALTCVVPLQLFAYHLALDRGTNPDSFRLDDPRFLRAYRRVTL